MMKSVGGHLITTAQTQQDEHRGEGGAIEEKNRILEIEK
jgi:hypothetical protein